MTYTVREIFYTLQGEGVNTGSPSVFCRFAGCNLWSGIEKDRSTAVCQFCDTDFAGTNGTCGGKYESAQALAVQIENQWPKATRDQRLVVLTGGEPLLQVDRPLIDELHRCGFRAAVETNGTIKPPPELDWVCVSPKAGAPLVVFKGNELKVVWPQPGLLLSDLERLDFDNYFLQPMDSPRQWENVELCIRTCLTNPRWRLSLQTHKIVGIR